MNRTLQTVISLILVGLYAAGLIAMITVSFDAGVILWVISTLGGIGFLYYLREKKKKEAAESGEDKPCE